MKQILAALVSVASLAGCATVPFGDAQQDAASKTFSVAPTRAASDVFRDEYLGGAEPSNSAPNVNKASATGAWIGGGTMAALGIASAPLLGPALAVVVAVVYGTKFAEAGAAIGSAIAGDKVEYPSPITIKIKRVPLPP